MVPAFTTRDESQDVISKDLELERGPEIELAAAGITSIEPSPGRGCAATRGQSTFAVLAVAPARRSRHAGVGARGRPHAHRGEQILGRSLSGS
jgi:hypothetical protein